MKKQNKICKLYYKEGSSDKVYNIYLMRVKDISDITWRRLNFDRGDRTNGGAWELYVTYGRRGKELKYSPKSDEVYSILNDQFEELKQSKLRKGYKIISETESIEKTESKKFPKIEMVSI